jgi:hypothetical protein
MEALHYGGLIVKQRHVCQAVKHIFEFFTLEVEKDRKESVFF